MKAPDKIYLPNGKEAVQNGLYKTWFDTDEHDMPYAEYIRKEALIGWLNSEIKKEMEDHYDDFSFGIAYGNVLEHINEM